MHSSPCHLVILSPNQSNSYLLRSAKHHNLILITGYSLIFSPWTNSRSFSTW